ncbi:MAG: serine/threonine protein kinase [Myxococcales bacterium]|nr:serine/threonine protein kinase [Myxococcales bacterium]
MSPSSSIARSSPPDRRFRRRVRVPPLGANLRAGRSVCNNHLRPPGGETSVIGRTVGNYVVRSQIGMGGWGAVYLAENPRIRRKVAIKMLHADLAREPEVVARFVTEARAANEIRNEHIIDILDFGDLPDGTPYFVMEWLDGRSLAAVIEGEKRLPVVRAVRIAVGVGRALVAAHARGIVHRDLKPENIFLLHRDGDPDFVKVLDFGIAKLLVKDTHERARFKTHSGAVLGTPSYMSPEQCRGAQREVDQRADVYALGVILYEMLTGCVPFVAEGLGGLLLLHMTTDPKPPRAIEPSVPEELDRVILQALAKDPQDRFQTVAAFLGALTGGPMPLSGTRSGPPNPLRLRR